jgi:hypothetical protein
VEESKTILQSDGVTLFDLVDPSREARGWIENTSTALLVFGNPNGGHARCRQSAFPATRRRKTVTLFHPLRADAMIWTRPILGAISVAWAGALGPVGARPVAFSAGKVAQLFQADGMAVRIEHSDSWPFERDKVHHLLMRRSCVRALLDDLTNARSRGYNEPHSLTHKASRNRSAAIRVSEKARTWPDSAESRLSQQVRAGRKGTRA